MPDFHAGSHTSLSIISSKQQSQHQADPTTPLLQHASDQAPFH